MNSWRLKGFYYATQISGILALAVLAAVIYFYQSYFTFFSNIPLALDFFGIIFAIHLAMFVLREIFHQNIFYTISRYAWVGFFFAMIYLTGGPDSAFIFILMFPLITSAVDLDADATKEMAILLTVLLAGMITLFPEQLQSPTHILQHIFRVTLFGTAAYYMYKIVKETLRQKYEKDQTKRKFSELIELEKVKTDFITVTQHQMRTPLTALRWGIDDLLTSQNLAGEVKGIVQTLGQEVDVSISILNQLLRTTEVEAGGFKLNNETI